MKNLITKKTLITAAMTMVMSMLFVLPCFATAGALDEVVSPVVDLINNLLGPVLAIVGAAGTIYCVVLGVKYARAEEPQDREKAKQHLKSAIIGFILIFVLIVALNLMLPYLTSWASKYQTTLQ